MNGPATPGGSPRHEGAKIAAKNAAQNNPAGRPAWPEQDTEPGWLDDDDLAPDPDGDERDWPQDGDEIRALAEAAQAEQDQIRDRLLASGVPECAFAHWPGAPQTPGVYDGPAGGFAQGHPLDTAAPDPALAEAADYASGRRRRFGKVSDDELFGLLGARRRLEARQAWERLTVLAELIRRRPAPGVKTDAASKMPLVWAEGTTGEVTIALAVSRHAADQQLGMAWDLTVKLPLTSRMLRDGIIDEGKASIICSWCANLTPEQARRAEGILFSLDDIETMTWGMIRDRIAKAVIDVDPDAARKRREDGAKERRIETGPESSGNAWLSARELPPVTVLAMDNKLTARARELRQAGVPGGTDELRVLAYLERFGEADPLAGLTRTRQDDTASGTGGDSHHDSGGDGHPGDGDHDDGGADGGTGGTGGTGGASGPRPGGNTGPGGGGCACGGTSNGIPAVIHLTIPASTLTRNAGRPGILRGTGPVDPDLARDYAAAAARHPATRYEFTITGPDGRPAAHGCGTPAPGDPARRRKAGKPGTPDPPPGTPRTAGPAPPRFELIDRGPPGSYGTWRYTHGSREIIVGFEDLAGPCDHTYQANGHDPGTHLRHLTGVLHQTCTHPACRRPEARCDYEHSRPYGQGGITCLCTCGPVCRTDHRDKQRPGWTLQGTGQRGWFQWTLPSGRTYLTKPTIYPI
jgi:hypothetical protein